MIAEEFLCNHTLRRVQNDVPAVEAGTFRNQIFKDIGEPPMFTQHKLPFTSSKTVRAEDAKQDLYRLVVGIEDCNPRKHVTGEV